MADSGRRREAAETVEQDHTCQQRQWLTVVDDEIQLERSSASKMKTRTGTCPEGTYEAIGTGPVRFRSPEDGA